MKSRAGFVARGVAPRALWAVLLVAPLAGCGDAPTEAIAPLDTAAQSGAAAAAGTRAAAATSKAAATAAPDATASPVAPVTPSAFVAPSRGPGTVLSSTEVALVERATLDAAARDEGIADLIGAAQCDVSIRSIVHATTGPGGWPARNSAALLLPQAGCPGPLGLLAYARGTSTDRTRTLADPADRETRLLMAVYAARGYVVVATDYLGYAQSDFPYHPYLDAGSEASSVIDAAVAARTVLMALAVAVPDGLLLAGYSQGGQAVLAAHRQLQATPIAGLPVLATGAMSGPYDLVLTFTSGVQSAVFPSLGDQAGRAAATPATLLLAGSLNSLTARLVAWRPVRDLLQRESVLGWTPQAPLLLCGGRRDPVVTFGNAIEAALDFGSRGAAPLLLDVEADPAYVARLQAGAADAAGYHNRLLPPICFQAVRDRLFAPRPSRP